ncbi:penicillin-binding protein [[Bacillus] enclensis]|uniref:serine-type D-Ala-D-Ala carboxypeptidase n=1 Tax=[Bacillus] enclensis TaxID=1402860 RepID=A0A0V8HNU1_9BACI|nr:penicillin-binding transpeptidase domain-containing protein [[Bacillus] enclensis]KSU63792.1 penicillin-binding protein [[Bacillus] enclensis]SCB89900.1 Cell division protein FtsI/penicillin-binding protein 2 [[Bacillus] enclensis]
MIRKRIRWLSIMLLLGIILLSARLMQLQLFQTESFSKHKINLIEESVAQRTQQLVIDEGRGQFLDRNGKPLTFQEKNVLVLFPFLKRMDWPVEEVARIIHVTPEIIETKIEQAKGPIVFGGKEAFQLSEEQMNEINGLKIQGVFAVTRKFKSGTIPASQLIGITGENTEEFHERYPDRVKGIHQKIGVTGMQEIFDEWLISEEQSKLIYHVDANGGPLFGADVKYLAPANPFYPLNVKTTIDMDIQQALEEVADRYKIEKGGLLLLDIENSQILADVSRPTMKSSDPFSGGADNYMLKALAPGSVFKTVVAAAAMDEGIVDESRMFNCDEGIYGAPAEKPHGMINIKSSIAVSCNRTFADLAKELVVKDPYSLEEYAGKLGLLGDIAWKGNVFHYEEFSQLPVSKGRVFVSDDERKDLNYIAQTGIGQREVRVTPLGLANMMATIARGGEKYMVNAATSIDYQNGTSMFSFPRKKMEGEKITPFTAMKLQQYLRGVVNSPEGTAPYLDTALYPIAGKTGTAQTGKESEGRELYNKWFAGYFPFENPKYALVAVNMDVHIDEGGIYPIFKDSVDAVHKLRE